MAKVGRPRTGVKPSFQVQLPACLKDYLQERSVKTHRSIPKYVEMLVFRDLRETENEDATTLEA